jgi:hypothetical protein
VLSKQISDPNLKVALNALSIFCEMSVRLPTLIENNLSVVANYIFNCDRVYNKKPLIYTKNIYNTLNKLLDENRPDIQPGLQRLAISCQSLVGNEVFSNTKAKIKEYIN